MKKSTYILHYVLVILFTYFVHERFATSVAHHSRQHHRLSNAPGIQGIRNSTDRVAVNLFNTAKSNKKAAKYTNQHKPRIKVRYKGGNCRYDLAPQIAETRSVQIARDRSEGHYVSYTLVAQRRLICPRGPPSLLS